MNKKISSSQNAINTVEQQNSEKQVNVDQKTPESNIITEFSKQRAIEVNGLTFDTIYVNKDGFLDFTNNEFYKNVSVFTGISESILHEYVDVVTDQKCYKKHEYIDSLIYVLCSLPFNKTMISKDPDGLYIIRPIHKIYRLRDILAGLREHQYKTSVNINTQTYSKYLVYTTTVKLTHDFFSVEGMNSFLFVADADDNNKELRHQINASKTYAIDNALKDLGIGLYLYI